MSIDGNIDIRIIVSYTNIGVLHSASVKIRGATRIIVIGTGIRVVFEGGHHHGGRGTIVQVNAIVGIAYITFVHINLRIGKTDIAARSLTDGAIHQLRLGGLVHINIVGSLFYHAITQSGGRIIVTTVVEIEAAPAAGLAILCGEMNAVSCITHSINATTIRAIITVSNFDLFSSIQADGVTRGDGQSWAVTARNIKVTTTYPIAIVFFVPSAVAINGTACHLNINAVVGESKRCFIVGEVAVGGVGIQTHIIV